MLHLLCQRDYINFYRDVSGQPRYLDCRAGWRSANVEPPVDLIHLREL